MFLKFFIYCKFVFAVLALPSTSRESDLGLYANSESTKGELWPNMATPGKEYVFLHFAGELGPIFHYWIRKKLTFDPDLVKSYSNNIHTTFDNLSYHGGDGKQKLFCALRWQWLICKLSWLKKSTIHTEFLWHLWVVSISHENLWSHNREEKS